MTIPEILLKTCISLIVIAAVLIITTVVFDLPFCLIAIGFGIAIFSAIVVFILAIWFPDQL